MSSSSMSVELYELLLGGQILSFIECLFVSVVLHIDFFWYQSSDYITMEESDI